MNQSNVSTVVMNENEAFALKHAIQKHSSFLTYVDYYPQGNGIGNLPAEDQKCYLRFRKLGHQELPETAVGRVAALEYLATLFDEDFNQFDLEEINEELDRMGDLSAYTGR